MKDLNKLNKSFVVVGTPRGKANIIACTIPCEDLMSVYGWDYSHSNEWMSDMDDEVSSQYPGARRTHDFCFHDHEGVLMQTLKYIQRKEES